MDVVKGLMIRPVFLDVVHFKPNIWGNPDAALSVNGYSYQNNMEQGGQISIPFGLDRTNVIAEDLRGLIDIDIKPSFDRNVALLLLGDTCRLTGVTSQENPSTDFHLIKEKCSYRPR